MSLDFYLKGPATTAQCRCIECGNEHTREDRETLFETNMTHNLGPMFDAAGVYRILWHGAGLMAGDVLPQLESALADMKANPDKYRLYDAPNGWGTYKHAVPWLASIIEARREHPTAVVDCWR